ncbi:hypothetical protein AVEN_162098-1 [Araneus ventricosus]|uniref:Uncharacterized protein n=1 Tax=Araneus ventricosus TaxID=182803 RepID=A0A4Y2LHX9_ARAVE|nr:hypothetical protein AVEN_162098-1 [Araneus ventricosus]
MRVLPIPSHTTATLSLPSRCLRMPGRTEWKRKKKRKKKEKKEKDRVVDEKEREKAKKICFVCKRGENSASRLPLVRTRVSISMKVFPCAAVKRATSETRRGNHWAKGRVSFELWVEIKMTRSSGLARTNLNYDYLFRIEKASRIYPEFD